MSEIKVNKVSPRTNCGTVQLGDSGDTITIPAGATITNNGTQTGFGRTGTVDWDTTPKTATFSAVSGDGFFCNTTSSAFTCNLPAGSAGAIVSLADYAGTWQTNALTVSPNGSEKIGGANADVTLNTEGQSVTFVYVDSTQGWINVQDSTSNERGNLYMVATGGTITTCGNDKIHTFTGPGTFTVCKVACCSANNLVSYAVVAAGAGGGGGDSGGGGGAGGFREVVSPSSPYTGSPLNGYPTPGNRITVTATSFPITVGGGGAGGCVSLPDAQKKGQNGNNSVFSTITAAGGGGGGGGPSGNPTPTVTGSNGGSGGGGASNPCGVPGGTGNTPPVTPAQGTNGGAGFAQPGQHRQGGGGGGATAAGTAASNCGGGPGGNGATSSINGTPTARAGGGGGGGHPSSPGPGAGGSGGSGGGGAGAGPSDPAAGAGTANTGGGGGAGNLCKAGGLGGSGVVIIRYRFQ